MLGVQVITDNLINILVVVEGENKNLIENITYRGNYAVWWDAKVKENKVAA